MGLNTKRLLEIQSSKSYVNVYLHFHATNNSFSFREGDMGVFALKIFDVQFPTTA
jgi:hypothetical protein